MGRGTGLGSGLREPNIQGQLEEVEMANHYYEMSRVGKLIETESRLAAEGIGKKKGMIANGYGISFFFYSS